MMGFARTSDGLVALVAHVGAVDGDDLALDLVGPARIVAVALQFV